MSGVVVTWCFKTSQPLRLYRGKNVRTMDKEQKNDKTERGIKWQHWADIPDMSVTSDTPPPGGVGWRWVGGGERERDLWGGGGGAERGLLLSGNQISFDGIAVIKPEEFGKSWTFTDTLCCSLSPPSSPTAPPPPPSTTHTHTRTHARTHARTHTHTMNCFPAVAVHSWPLSNK